MRKSPPIKVTLRYSPSGGHPAYLIEQISGAVVLYHDGNKPLHVGDVVPEQTAERMAMSYNVITLAK
jgi:hypothetical protein